MRRGEVFWFVKAKFHYASWFEAGRRQVRSWNLALSWAGLRASSSERRAGMWRVWSGLVAVRVRPRRVRRIPRHHDTSTARQLAARLDPERHAGQCCHDSSVTCVCVCVCVCHANCRHESGNSLSTEDVHIWWTIYIARWSCSRIAIVPPKSYSFLLILLLLLLLRILQTSAVDKSPILGLCLC